MGPRTQVPESPSAQEPESPRAQEPECPRAQVPENTITIFFINNFDSQGPLCIINFGFWIFLKKNQFKKTNFLSWIRIVFPDPGTNFCQKNPKSKIYLVTGTKNPDIS
jgi:hypothetical protein